MSKDEQAIEAEIQTKGLTAKRITPEMIDDEIAGQDFHVFPASCLTVCCLTLKNGYTVTGESACAQAPASTAFRSIAATWWSVNSTGRRRFSSNSMVVSAGRDSVVR